MKKPIFTILPIVLVGLALTSYRGNNSQSEYDIMAKAEKYPQTQRIQNPDGTWRTSKYGDYKLEKVEELLKTKYKRRWTVSRHNLLLEVL